MSKYQDYLKLITEGAITVVSKKKVTHPRDMFDKWTEIKFSNGKTLNLSKLNSTQSMGVPGWHDNDAKDHSYMGDTIEDAIAAYIARQK